MKPHRKIAGLLSAALLLAASASATSHPFTITIDATSPGVAIPANFMGASISSNNIAPSGGTLQLFTKDNTQLVNLFKQIGIKHLRTINGKADPTSPDPTNQQVDDFFDFAKSIGATNVIWSLHLMNADTDGSPDVDRNTSWSKNTSIATHIWNTTTAYGANEQTLLESFAFDNEPDWLGYINGADPVITGYSTPTGDGYIDEWREWKARIKTTGVAPSCKFSGPDTGSKYPVQNPSGQTTEPNTEIGGLPFTLRFARDESGTIMTASQHYYGAHSADTNGNFLSTQALADICLASTVLSTNYQSLYSNALNGAATWPNDTSGAAMPYRFTECSPFTNNGGNPGQHCVATALWGLEFCHWWARHGCAGVDPFTRPVQYNSPIYDPAGGGTTFEAAAYGYGLKAFMIGGSGNVIYTNKLTISNPNAMNATAYGVVNAAAGHLYVTIINKGSTGDGAAAVTINTGTSPNTFNIVHARSIILAAGSTAGAWGDPTATGANIGGNTMDPNSATFPVSWTTVSVPNNHSVSVTVQPTNAMIVDLESF